MKFNSLLDSHCLPEKDASNQVYWLSEMWHLWHFHQSNVTLQPELVCMRRFGVSTFQTEIQAVINSVLTGHCLWSPSQCSQGAGFLFHRLGFQGNQEYKEEAWPLWPKYKLFDNIDSTLSIIHSKRCIHSIDIWWQIPIDIQGINLQTITLFFSLGWVGKGDKFTKISHVFPSPHPNNIIE